MSETAEKSAPVETDPDVLHARVVDFQRRVATNVNDLQHELSPKTIAVNAKESAQELVQNPDGTLKTKALVIAGVAVAAVALLIVLKRKK